MIHSLVVLRVKSSEAIELNMDSYKVMASAPCLPPHADSLCSNQSEEVHETRGSESLLLTG